MGREFWSATGAAPDAPVLHAGPAGRRSHHNPGLGWRRLFDPPTWVYLLDEAGGPGVGRSPGSVPGAPASFLGSDYLSLANHPRIRAATIEVAGRAGPLPVQSGPRGAGSRPAEGLEQQLGALLEAAYVSLYPTAWAATYGGISGLLGAEGHVVIDMLAHQALRECSRAVTDNISLYTHLDLDHAREQLTRIRNREAQARILLVLESTFAVDAASSDLQGFQALAEEFGAILVVDVAQDSGVQRPRWRWPV